MDEVTVLMITANLALFALLLDHYKTKHRTGERFDFITEGIVELGTELLSRTDQLMEKAGGMPEISLINQDPLTSIVNFVKAMKGINSEENITNRPRTEGGRWISHAATFEEEENHTPQETVDVTN